MLFRYRRVRISVQYFSRNFLYRCVYRPFCMFFFANAACTSLRTTALMLVTSAAFR